MCLIGISVLTEIHLKFIPILLLYSQSHCALFRLRRTGNEINFSFIEIQIGMEIGIDKNKTVRVVTVIVKTVFFKQKKTTKRETKFHWINLSLI